MFGIKQDLRVTKFYERGKVQGFTKKANKKALLAGFLFEVKIAGEVSRGFAAIRKFLLF